MSGLVAIAGITGFVLLLIHGHWGWALLENIVKAVRDDG